MLGLTRDDLLYILVHGFVFIAAYSASMAALHAPGIFNWNALAQALLTAGSTNIGINLANSRSDSPGTITTPSVASNEAKQIEEKQITKE